MLLISGVEPGGIGDQLGLEEGDRLLSINGNSVNDIIDIQILVADEDLLLEVEKQDGELWDLEIEKETFQPLGLEFPPMEPMQCGNNCIFCFVHQLPPRMRPSLYVKDEDYRFSFLYGSYVTLSNISEPELQRIFDQHLSPLYVSVHATNDQLRNRLLGREVPSILELLERLTAGGIKIHTQVVVCPGINDGEALTRTIEDLWRLYPGLNSLAVVPVGLTGYRGKLPDLRAFSVSEAKRLLMILHRYQDRFLSESGTRFVFAADEIYQLADMPVPELDVYEDLPQLENGVGMIALFRTGARRALQNIGKIEVPPVGLVTGISAARELKRFAFEIQKKTGADIRVFPIENRFFGGQVTVAGLLTGRDLIEQLSGSCIGDVLLIPDVMLKEGEDVLLDDMTLGDLGNRLGVRVLKVDTSPEGLVAALEDICRPRGTKPERALNFREGFTRIDKKGG